MDTNELLKLLSSVVALLTAVVSLITAIVSVRRARIELSRQRIESARKELPPPELVVKLNALQKEDPGKVQVHGFAGLPLPADFALSFLAPVTIAVGMPISERVHKLLQRASGFTLIAGLLLAAPVTMRLADPSIRGVNFVPSMGALLALIGGFLVAVMLVRIFDRPAP